MQLPYFYQQNMGSNNSSLFLSEDTSRHCIQVLRMKTDENLQLTDGKGNLITATITIADKKNCMVRVETISNQQPAPRNTSVAISLLKNATRFEWFLEKATEIGISEIAPMLCRRTERQHFRFERMNAILVSAMLQSRQTWLPILQQPVPFEKIIVNNTYPQKLIAHCEVDAKKSIPDFMIGNKVQVLIGPEGDFTHEEIQAALQNNYLPVSLGNTRLRTETAGIVVATLLMNSRA